MTGGELMHVANVGSYFMQSSYTRMYMYSQKTNVPMITIVYFNNLLRNQISLGTKV